VVSFAPRPLYPREKSPRYPLDGRLGGPQKRSGLRGEEKGRVNRSMKILKKDRRCFDWNSYRVAANVSEVCCYLISEDNNERQEGENLK
jgi:hypothetical protein